MKKSLMVLLVAGSCAALQSVAADSPMKKEFDAANARAATAYQAARSACTSVSGSQKGLCLEQARAQQTRSRADALAVYVDTPKARVNARKAIADADFDVAREKCKALSGNPRDVCVSQAKAAHVATIADANSDLKVSTARTEAMEEKRTAEYKVEREKCDVFSGAEKSTCVDLAKAKYGQ